MNKQFNECFPSTCNQKLYLHDMYELYPSASHGQEPGQTGSPLFEGPTSILLANHVQLYILPLSQQLAVLLTDTHE